MLRLYVKRPPEELKNPGSSRLLRLYLKKSSEELERGDKVEEPAVDAKAVEVDKVEEPGVDAKALEVSC